MLIDDGGSVREGNCAMMNVVGSPKRRHLYRGTVVGNQSSFLIAAAIADGAECELLRRW